jgi:hypothetical protein
MQSMEALHEKRWGQYPYLDQLLSDNQSSMEWTCPTSVSSNIFNQIDDLLSVFALVSDRYKTIQQLSHKPENDNLRRELRVLSEHLNWMSEFFKDASNRVQQY